MSTDHNRIKVADLEKNQPNKILITNINGELAFSDMNNLELESPTFTGVVTSSSFKTTDGTSSQFLKADGSVDSTPYDYQSNRNLISNANYSPSIPGYQYTFGKQLGVNQGYRFAFGRTFNGTANPVQSDGYYSVSFWYRVENYVSGLNVSVQVNDRDGTALDVSSDKGWTFYSSTIYVNKLINSWGFLDIEGNHNSTITISDISVTRSAKPEQQYTPAPEDFLSYAPDNKLQTLSSLGVAGNVQSGFQLDVHGNSVIRGNVLLSGNLINFSNSNYTLSYTGNSILNLVSGNLLIGTTTDNGSKLQVNGAVTGTNLLYNNRASTTIGTGVTNSDVLLYVSDSGIGYSNGFRFNKANDAAGINVTEISSDYLQYEFWMSDNPDSSDHFAWRYTDWQGKNGGIVPFYIANKTLRFTGINSLFNSSIDQISTAYYTTLEPQATVTASTNIQHINEIAYTKVSSVGGLQLTNLNISGYSGSNGAVMWIKLTSTTQFNWGYGSWNSGTATETGLTVSTSTQTLSNGVTVAFSTTSGVVGDAYQFRAFVKPTTKLSRTFIGTTDTSGTDVLKVNGTSSFFGLVTGIEGTASNHFVTKSQLNLKADIASPTFTGTVSGIDKTMVGLSNVDNTSDLSKPISTAIQTALNLKANLASPTFTGNVTFLTNLFSNTNNLILNDSSGVIFRGVRANAWSDSVNTRFFQVGNSNDNTMFTSQSGTNFNRLGLFSSATQISTAGYLSALVPSGIFEVSGASTRFFNIFSTGNVVINGGIDNATDKLQVNGSIRTRKGSNSDTVIPSNAGAYLLGDNVGLAVGQFASNTYGTWLQSIRQTDNASFPLILNPNGGNVGIGTTSPTAKLHINGDIVATEGLRYGKATNIDNVDLNDVFGAGFYAGENLINSPTTGGYCVVVEVLSFGFWGKQTVTSLGSGNTEGITYTRTLENGIWTPWKQLAITNSPVFTGTPTAPTATIGTNTTQIATTAFVSAIDENVVHKTGTEHITGNKIFSKISLSDVDGIGEPYMMNTENGVNLFIPSGNGFTVNGQSFVTSTFVQESKKIIVRKISSAITLADSDNATVILLTTSCTVTLPNGLMSGFNCSFATQSGATLTYSLGGSVVLINNSGTTMLPLSSHTLVNTGTTNEYLTVGL